MTSLETMLRESLWATTLTSEQLDRVVRESHERRVSVGGYAMRCGEPADQWVGVSKVWSKCRSRWPTAGSRPSPA